MKKALSVFLVVVIMLTAAPLSEFVDLKFPEWLNTTIQANAAEAPEGSTIITTVEGLDAIRENLDGTYILANDIDMSSIENWTPIGNENAPFTGTLDGNGYSIKNLTINLELDVNKGDSVLNAAFFSNVNGGTIKSLGIEDADIYYFLGGSTTSSLTFCNAAGFAGELKNSSIKNCFFTGSVSAETIYNSYVRASAFGNCVSSSITNCYSNADISAKADYANTMVGGIASWNDTTTINKCYAAGTLYAKNTNSYVYCGGIAASGGGTISSCAALQSAITTVGETVYNGTSFVDVICPISTLSNNIALKTLTSSLNNKSAYSVSDDLAKTKATYTNIGWDFENTWTINNAYPVLNLKHTAYAIYPSDYNYDEDSYSFSNSSVADTVSVNIYKDVFGDKKGQIVYDVMEKDEDSHGLCYGMAATTACLLNDIPYVDSFLKITGPCKTISDINRGTKSIELDMITAKTFIKYGYVTQFSTHAERIWDCESLYNAVWDYVYNGGAPVIVSMRTGDEYNEGESKYEQTVGHAVLAIGIEGNDTIIVDDSNSPDEERKITLTRNSDGEFTGEWKCDDYSWSYGNNNAEGTPSHVGIIGYTTAVILPSMVKMYHAELDTNITSAEEDESSDAICDFEEIHTEYNLLYTSSDEINIACDSDKLMKLDDPITGGSIFSDSSSLYWVDNDKDISLENISDEDVQVKFTDNYSGIATSLTTGSKIKALADDSTNNYVEINCVNGEEVDVTFSLVDCTGEEVEVVVSATANDESVTASLTDNGISISGVSNGGLSVIKYDEIVETKTITEGEVEIETELPNAGHNFVDGVCTDCGERTIQVKEMSSQIRFNRNEDGSYAETFDVRTRAKISDKDFTELVGATTEEAVNNIDKVGFVYTLDGENFSSTSAQAVAQGEKISGYTDAPVSYVQDADGYYMFTCLVTNIPENDKNYTLTAYAYICVNGKWYFSEVPMNADFNSLYETYYPKACEKYGW